MIAHGAGEWLRPLREWPQALQRRLMREGAVARVVVAAVLGSVPREAGACMLVWNSGLEGSIGGGQLEWQAQTAARRLVAEAQSSPVNLRRLVLAADLEQCCGGVVDLWIERFTRADLQALQAIETAARSDHPVVLASTMLSHSVIRHAVSNPDGGNAEVDGLLRAPRREATPRLIRAANGSVTLLERLDAGLPAVWLYGAGHVGQALARICAELPLRLTWIDSRAELFPRAVPESITMVHDSQPVRSVATAPAGTSFLVLTHSHALDYELCRAILERKDFAWLGLIGSKSKSARFRSRLARDGLSSDAIARLVCPIGIRAIESKWPAAIAVGVAAQLLGEGAPPGRSRHEVMIESGGAHSLGGCAAQSCTACRPPAPRIFVGGRRSSSESEL